MENTWDREDTKDRKFRRAEIEDIADLWTTYTKRGGRHSHEKGLYNGSGYPGQPK